MSATSDNEGRFDPRSILSLAGRVTFSSCAPHPALEADVSCYWTADFGEGENIISSLPDGSIDVTFDLLQHQGWITAAQQTERTHRFPGPVSLLGIRFVPGAVARLTG